MGFTLQNNSRNTQKHRNTSRKCHSKLPPWAFKANFRASTVELPFSEIPDQRPLLFHDHCWLISELVGRRGFCLQPNVDLVKGRQFWAIVRGFAWWVMLTGTQLCRVMLILSIRQIGSLFIINPQRHKYPSGTEKTIPLHANLSTSPTAFITVDGARVC